MLRAGQASAWPDGPFITPIAFAIDRVCTFVSLRPDTMVFNAAISACEKGRAWATALRLMQQMRGMGCQPTAVTYGASISACEKGLQWQKVRIGGRESSLARISLCDPASHPHTHLCLHLRHFCRPPPLAPLAQMDDEGIKPNTIVYSAAISACGASGEYEAALALFERMEQLKVPRNTISYNAAIQACARGQAWRQALTLFDRMATAGVKRDHVTYNAVVRACETAGEYKLAFDLRMEGAAAVRHENGDDGDAVAEAEAAEAAEARMRRD